MSKVIVRSSAFRTSGRVMSRDRERRPDNRPLGDLLLRPGERPSERRPILTTDHQPVMVDEVLHFLSPRPGGVYVDCTVGAGGHAEAILNAVGGRATLIGIDRDPDALARARHNLHRFRGSVHLVQGDFSEIEWIVRSQDVHRSGDTPGPGRVDGILLDLGMSSMQVDTAARGFSFRNDGPLDMRMDPSQTLTAADVVNSYEETELVRILRAYGEERHARRIARAIIDARRKSPLRTTRELSEIVEQAYPAGSRGYHPSRRTFQALRIEVNRELEALESVLRAAPDVLAADGRVVVISYHSLEDRLTKRTIGSFTGKGRALPGLGEPPATGVLAELTRGAVLPSETESERNPRASSARLRAAVRRPLAA
jgi:16S rRNA (cytosine1402-N4)-methyltransferase